MFTTNIGVELLDFIGYRNILCIFGYWVYSYIFDSFSMLIDCYIDALVGAWEAPSSKNED